jgi:hypothetical protein
MSTERQIESNRENAKHSTGPASAEGKAISSRNHTRHSLTARGLIILPDQKDDFADLEAGLRARLIPSGELQESILESNWNLYRCQLAEAQLYSESGIDPLLDDVNAARYDRIQKYSRQYENSIYKALRVLADLQTDAEFRLHIAPEEQLSDTRPSNGCRIPPPHRPRGAVVRHLPLSKGDVERPRRKITHRGPLSRIHHVPSPIGFELENGLDGHAARYSDNPLS